MDKEGQHKLSSTSASDSFKSNPNFLRMNSTKSEISEKSAGDSGFLSGTNLDNYNNSTCSLLSEDCLSSSADLPHDKVTLETIPNQYLSGLDIANELSNLKLIPDSHSDKIRTSSETFDSGIINSAENILEEFSSKHENKQKFPDNELWKNIYCQDRDGDTQLHIAIADQLGENIVQKIVSVAPSSVCLDVRNDLAQTALHLAVLTNQPEIVRLLVLCNANLSKLDHFVRTPLHWAVNLGSVECVRALTNPITSKEIRDISHIVPVAWKYRTRLTNETINLTDCEGVTCVHLAAINGNVDIMRQLVIHGADLNSREWKSGKTALHIAVENRNFQMVQFLTSDELQALEKLDVDCENYAGFTPYQLSYDNTIGKLLLERGAENLPNADDEDDMMMSNEEDSDEENFDDQMDLNIAPVMLNGITVI